MERVTTDQIKSAVLRYFDSVGDRDTTDALADVFDDSAGVREMLFATFPGMPAESLGSLAIGIAIGLGLRAEPGLFTRTEAAA